MSFTVQDFNDLTRLLVEHPEWRSELRRLLLSDELLTLPQAVRELIEAHKQAEERLQRLETAVESLAEAQQRTEERLQGVEERLQRLEMIVERLVEAQQRAEERLSRLETTVQSLVEQVSILAESQQRTQDTVGGMKGRLLELTYHQKAGAYFAPLLRRVRVVEPHTLEDTLEAHLTPGEFRDVLRLDLLLSGFLRQKSETPEVWLAVEISAVVDQNDVDRAERQAGLLQKAGYRALPVAAGEQMTRGAEVSARAQKVALLQDGRALFWEEALETWFDNTKYSC